MTPIVQFCVSYRFPRGSPFLQPNWEGAPCLVGHRLPCPRQRRNLAFPDLPMMDDGLHCSCCSDYFLSRNGDGGAVAAVLQVFEVGDHFADGLVRADLQAQRKPQGTPRECVRGKEEKQREYLQCACVGFAVRHL